MFGYVREMVLHGPSAIPCFVVDFGSYLGVQIIPIYHCHPYMPPKVSEAELQAVEAVI